MDFRLIGGRKRRSSGFCKKFDAKEEMLKAQYLHGENVLGSRSFPAPPLTLCHVNQAASQQGHAVGGLVVVQVLKSPASDVGLLVHQARGVADRLEEALLLALGQVLVHEVVRGGKPHQGVGQRDFVPGSVSDQPADTTGGGDSRFPSSTPHRTISGLFRNSQSSPSCRFHFHWLS